MNERFCTFDRKPQACALPARRAQLDHSRVRYRFPESQVISLLSFVIPAKAGIQSKTGTGYPPSRV